MKIDIQGRWSAFITNGREEWWILIGEFRNDATKLLQFPSVMRQHAKKNMCLSLIYTSSKRTVFKSVISCSRVLFTYYANHWKISHFCGNSSQRENSFVRIDATLRQNTNSSCNFSNLGQKNPTLFHFGSIYFQHRIKSNFLQCVWCPLEQNVIIKSHLISNALITFTFVFVIFRKFLFPPFIIFRSNRSKKSVWM